MIGGMSLFKSHTVMLGLWRMGMRRSQWAFTMVKPSIKLAQLQQQRRASLPFMCNLYKLPVTEDAVNFIKGFEKLPLPSESFYEQLVDEMVQHDMIGCNVDLACSQPLDSLSMRDLTQYLTHTFSFWGQILKNMYQKHHSLVPLRAMIAYVDWFNSCILSIRINNELLLNYLGMIDMLKRVHGVDKSGELTQVRIVYDTIIDKRLQFIQRDLVFVLYFISRFSIQIKYFTRAHAIINYLLSQLPSGWHQKKSSRTVIKALASLSITNNAIIGIIKELWNHTDPKKQFMGLNMLIYLREIDKQSIVTYASKVKRCVLADPDNHFVESHLNFYRAGLWIPEYWIPFCQWIKLPKNSAKIRPYDLYVINDLMTIEKESIAPSIQKAWADAKKSLETNGIRFDNIDYARDYNKQFQQVKRGLSAQNGILMALTVVSPRRVQTEKLVAFFFVDIIIDNKKIVEVNSSMHFLKNADTNKEKHTLKTEFRKRILEQLGYTFISVSVNDSHENNFSIIREIFGKQIGSDEPGAGTDGKTSEK